MAESMTEDGGLNRLIAAPNLNLNTRTRDPMAETRDLKMIYPPQLIIRSPVSL
jgi:hypothetical protein